MDASELLRKLEENPDGMKRLEKFANGIFAEIEPRKKLKDVPNEGIAFLLLQLIWAELDTFSTAATVVDVAIERLTPELVDDEDGLMWTQDWSELLEKVEGKK